MWLIPLVWGWFAVGTHHGRRRQVMEKLHEKVGDIILPTNETADPNEHLAVRICDPEKPRNRIEISKPLLDEDVSTKRRSIFGFSIEGDELADGPFYNYARCATWSHLAYKIIHAYANAHSIPLRQASDSTTNLSQVDISGNTTNDDPEKFGIFHQSWRENATGDLRFARVLSECRISQSGPLKRFAWKDSRVRYWFGEKKGASVFHGCCAARCLRLVGIYDRLHDAYNWHWLPCAYMYDI